MTQPRTNPNNDTTAAASSSGHRTGRHRATTAAASAASDGHAWGSVARTRSGLTFSISAGPQHPLVFVDVGAAACSFLLPLLPLSSALHGSARLFVSAAHRRPIPLPRDLSYQDLRVSARCYAQRLAPKLDAFRTGNSIRFSHRGVTVEPATLSANQASTTDPRSAGTESASPLPSPAMTRQPGLEPNPRSYLADGAQWPAGHLRPNSPPVALLARAISRRLHKALAGRSTRQIAELAGLSHQTVINVLNGATWWDTITIARLERALDTKLWGKEHRKPRTRTKR